MPQKPTFHMSCASPANTISFAASGKHTNTDTYHTSRKARARVMRAVGLLAIQLDRGLKLRRHE